MAPRLNKRQLREMAELAELSNTIKIESNGEDLEQDDEEQEEEQVTQRLNKSMFDALNTGEDTKEEEEDDDDEQEEVLQVKKSKNKKKKKKTMTTITNNSTIDSIPSTPSKKSNNKSSTTPKSTASISTDGMDEIDLALAEIAKKSGEVYVSTKENSSTFMNGKNRLDSKYQALQESFSFDSKYLDPEVELRKMFGSKVINSTPVIAPRSRHHARLANNPHHAVSMKRTSTYLATPESGWSLPKGVVTLKPYDGLESDSIGDWFTFEHPIEYREAQLKFLEILQQADGNKLYNVLEMNPYHVDTLMQLSEMMVQQGDLDLSSKHLSKALYALSTPLPPSFTSGTFRLPYSQIENRAFFLGVARKVAILTKRGTWRTACEWSKIALGVGGEHDPVGMLMYIDFLAPKAKENQWFLNTLVSLKNAYPDMKVENYPGLAYAKALCLRNLEEENSQDNVKSTDALRSAILRFPMVANSLLSSLGGTIPPKLVTHRRAQLDGAFTKNPSYLTSLLSQLYSVRSLPIWKEPKNLVWLQKTIESCFNSLDDSNELDVIFGEQIWLNGGWPKGVAPSGVIRGAYLSEIPSVKPYLPPSALSGTTYSYDPLPPSQSTSTFYDDKYFSPLHAARSSRRPPTNQNNNPLVGGGAGMAQAMRNQLAAMLGFGGNDPIPLTDELRAELMNDLNALNDDIDINGNGNGGDQIPPPPPVVDVGGGNDHPGMTDEMRDRLDQLIRELNALQPDNDGYYRGGEDDEDEEERAYPGGYPGIIEVDVDNEREYAEEEEEEEEEEGGGGLLARLGGLFGAARGGNVAP